MAYLTELQGLCGYIYATGFKGSWKDRGLVRVCHRRGSRNSQESNRTIVSGFEFVPFHIHFATLYLHKTQPIFSRSSLFQHGAH